MNKSSLLSFFAIAAMMGAGIDTHDPEIDKYIEDTIDMLPENKKAYWRKRVYSLKTDEDRMERCKALRKHFIEE